MEAWPGISETHLRVDAFPREERGAGVSEIVEAQILPHTGACLDALEGAVTQV